MSEDDPGGEVVADRHLRQRARGNAHIRSERLPVRVGSRARGFGDLTGSSDDRSRVPSSAVGDSHRTITMPTRLEPRSRHGGNASSLTSSPRGNPVASSRSSRTTPSRRKCSSKGLRAARISWVRPALPETLQDREIVSSDNNTVVMRWVDPEVAHRYGTMVLARCEKA